MHNVYFVSSEDSGESNALISIEFKLYSRIRHSPANDIHLFPMDTFSGPNMIRQTGKAYGLLHQWYLWMKVRTINRKEWFRTEYLDALNQARIFIFLLEFYQDPPLIWKDDLSVDKVSVSPKPELSCGGCGSKLKHFINYRRNGRNIAPR